MAERGWGEQVAEVRTYYQKKIKEVEAQLAETKAALDRATFGKIEQASKLDQA